MISEMSFQERATLFATLSSIAYMDKNDYPFTNYQKSEVSKVEWFSYKECLKIIRPYNLEKIDYTFEVNSESFRLNDINLFLNDKNILLPQLIILRKKDKFSISVNTDFDYRSTSLIQNPFPYKMNK